MALSEYKGKIGVILIALSLALSIGMGYLVSVDKTTTTTTDYEYVTDVSGLWDYDSQPQYVTYDTPKNYTGYQEYNATAVSETETKTNTAVSGETWLTSTTYTGTLPLSAVYNIYVGGYYITINGETVTYTYGTETHSITNVSYVSILADRLNIVQSDGTITAIMCDPSTAIYRNVSGYDVLGEGTDTLYQLSEGTTFYFKSTNKVYQIENNIATQITSSTSGITAIGDGYMGTVSGTVLIDTLTVSITFTSTNTYSNTSSATASIGVITNPSYPYWAPIDTMSVGSTVTLYGNLGRIVITMTSESGNYSITEYNSSNQVIQSYSDILYVNKISCTYNSSNNTARYSFYTDAWRYTQYYDASLMICDDVNASKQLGFGASPTTINVLASGSTYYYKDASTIYSFGNTLTTGVSGATALGDAYTGTVSVPTFTNVQSVTITESSSTTYSNTRNSSQTEYEYGLTTGDNIRTSTEYRLYIGDKYIFWHGYDVYIYTSSTTDHVTLTTPMSISSGTLTITGTSTLYPSGHTYTISLTAPYAYYSPLGDTILTGSTLYRLSGTAWYKSSSTIFMYSDYQVTSTIGGTSYQHGLFYKNVGDLLIWTDSLTVTSDSYTSYDYTDLSRTGNNGVSYTSTTQANNYVISSTTVSQTITGWSKSQYATGGVLSGTYVTIPTRSAILCQSGDIPTAYKPVSSGTSYYMLDDIYTDGSSSISYSGQFNSSGHLMRGMTVGSFLTAIGVPSSATNITLDLRVNDNIFLGTSANNTWDNGSLYIGVGTYTHFKTSLGDQILTVNTTNNTVTTDSGTYPSSEYTIYWCIGECYGVYNPNNTPSSSSSACPQTSFENGTSYDGIQYSADVDSVVPAYMVIKDGVHINTASAQKITEWKNGHQNGKVEILFHADLSNVYYQNTLILPTTDTITITHYANTETKISFNGGEEQYIGNWNSYVLSIDAQNGKVTAIPCDIFVNYQQYNRTDYSYSIGTFTPNQEINKILYEYTSSSWGFSVVSTDVFLNTYDSVMKDATLTINDYFTNLGETRLNFYSFAVYGSSMTINGHTYYGSSTAQSINVTNNIAIPIYDDQGTITKYDIHPLTNIYITYGTDGKTYLTFDDEGITYDLGTTVNQTISFSGNWYFTTGLYKGVTSTESHYEWELGKITWELPTIALIFIGLMILGYIIVRRFTDAEFTVIDYCLMIGALAIALVLTGGLLK